MCSAVLIDIIVYVSFFFFFKQKTAYEMRISDWSSDVCSSDLHHCAQPVMDRFGVTATARASLSFYNTREEIDALADGVRKVSEIGRASCRERVCQYV